MLNTEGNPSWCCFNGQFPSLRLRPYPPNIDALLSEGRASDISRQLNNLFCFYTIGVHGSFHNLRSPSNVFLCGRPYHCMLGLEHGQHPLRWSLYPSEDRHPTAAHIEVGSSIVHQTSGKTISVRAEWLRQGGCAPSEPSESPRWQTTPRPAPIGQVALHIALRSRICRFVSLCRYPIVNDLRGVVAHCDHMSQSVQWVHQQNVYWSRSHSQGSISKRVLISHIRLCYSHKIRYLIIWHTLFTYLYIYTSTAVSPPSTFRHNSGDLQTEFVRKNGSSLRSLRTK